MTEKQINKWLRRQFTGVGWALIGYYFLMNLLVTAAMYLDMGKQAMWNLATGEFLLDFNMDAILNNAWGYILSGALFFVILWAWKGSHYFTQEILVRKKRMRFSVLFAMASLIMGAQMVNTLWITLLELLMNAMGRSVMEVLETVSGATDSVSMFLYSALFAPLVEELIFRGFVLRSLQPYGKRFAVLGSAILFGLFHGNLLQTPYAIAAGLVLGYVTVEYSIGWAVVIHIFNNLVLAEGLSRLTMGMDEMTAGLINLGLFGGFTLVSAVILVRNRREIREYRCSEWIDRRCVKCLFTNSGVLILAVVMIVTMFLIFLG